MADDIGDRFKSYEAAFDFTLPPRMPMVVRVDGRGFHGLKLGKPFDTFFLSCMVKAATALCDEIQGARLAYLQSDEISIVARDDMSLQSQAWFGKRLSKVLSVSAAVATKAFNSAWHGPLVEFDSRAFVLPDLNEITNYLIWRQQDATRNSVSMAARAVFSHRQCHEKASPEMIEMLRAAGKPWEDVPTHFKRGCIVRSVTVPKLVEQINATVDRREWQPDYEIPVFTQDRDYVAALYSSLPPFPEEPPTE